MSIDVPRLLSGSKELMTWAGAACTRTTAGVAGGKAAFCSDRTTALPRGRTIVNPAAPTVTPKKERREIAIGCLYSRDWVESTLKFDTVCRRFEQETNPARTT